MNNQAPKPQTILAMLERLNQAYQAYNISLPSPTRLQTATAFYQCYMWLLQHHIPFRYDQIQHSYFLVSMSTRQEVSSQ
ncbi:hypothetical protein EPA93_31160 [Ktedonosporobacter rubrisoli]|uniref:Uncharacterized protein n=1 Tax=Ktedonosporobacter rubrisoli TaxID=2509675 RepID=A0A4P6JWV1_KTERU|nr:hypothetical protein [Ktedonosporobacter rubrisoli]QBD80199.1 hypothetical protein EPA93_31160 [Ktedonosporobacter rubrisoli]